MNNQDRHDKKGERFVHNPPRNPFLSVHHTVHKEKLFKTHPVMKDYKQVVNRGKPQGKTPGYEHSHRTLKEEKFYIYIFFLYKGC